jgi:diguanylate cyclase (GGDEF)-like protein
MMEHQVVLVAVSDLVEQAQLEQVLTEEGFEVATSDNAASLIDQAESRRPTAIIIDHDFGRPRGGLSLCRHLKANPVTRALAVILVCRRVDIVHPTDGTDGLPDEVLVRPIHQPEVVIRISTVQRLHRYASEAVQGSRLDPLTGTFNHNYLLDRLRHEVMRAGRYGRSLALVLVDVDGFTGLNEREGSTCADLMLREVARALTSRLRGVDLVARSGADEFSVVLPETSLLVARPIAERLRKAVQALRCQVPAEDERVITVTVSLGIAGLPHPEVVDVPDLLRCARSALARASEAGGNRSVLY